MNSFCHQLVYSIDIYKGKSLVDVTSCDRRTKNVKKLDELHKKKLKREKNKSLNLNQQMNVIK